MKKLRVMHIIPMLGPGGAEHVVVHIARGLNRQRFEVAVLSIWRRVGSDLEQLLDHSDVQVSYLGKSSGFDGRIYQRLHRVLKDYRPDVVHTHLHVLRYALPSMLLLRQMSCLHTVHNLAEREIEPRARCIQRYALTHGLCPVAVSKEVAVSLEQCYGIRNSRVIPNGIPTSDYSVSRISRSEWRRREGFRDDQILFVCVARFAPQKNHALLLKAFSGRPASDPRAHLVLIGEGDLHEQLTEHAASLGLTHKIHFLGLRTDIADALSATDVFVLSSDWEGNPLSVMEAMAAGLPIVSTAVGGVPDLFTNEKEGILVPPGNASRLSNAMAALLASTETRRSMGMGGQARAKNHFDVSRMIREYEQIYESLRDRSLRLKAEKILQRHDLFLREV